MNPATQSVAEGGAASIYITPDAGHHITGITDNGIPASVANPYVINNVTANHTVSVDFIINQYVVTPVAGPNGSIDPTTPQAINYNETASFAIIPDTGYHIESVTGCEGLLSGNTYTTGLIAGDCTVTATFAAGQYSVTAQMTGSGMEQSGNRSILWWPAVQRLLQFGRIGHAHCSASSGFALYKLGWLR